MKQENFIYWVVKHRNFNEIISRISDLLLGYIIYPLSYLISRNKQKWIFGNKTGFSDNSKYLFIYVIEKYPNNIRPIWIASSKEEEDCAKNIGVEVYRRWSLRGIFHSLTGGVYIYSSNVNDINFWTSGRAFKINLWHGVGIKKLGLKGSAIHNPNSLLKRLLTPYLYCKPNRFITTSELMDKHFKDCYALSDKQTYRAGYPRCDFLRLDLKSVESFINKYESLDIINLKNSLKRFRKIYIYMPTFRDDQSDFMKLSGIDVFDLNNIMVKNNDLMLFKMHPATRINSIEIDKLSNVKMLEKNIDIYPLLPYTDVLITDYSSIYYDYILMDKKQIILFPFDYEKYIKNSRDLAFDYSKYTPGVKVSSYLQLRELLKKNVKLDFDEREWVIETFWGNTYKDASLSIVQHAQISLDFFV